MKRITAAIGILAAVAIIPFGLWSQGPANAVGPQNITITGTGATVQVYAAGGLALSVQYLAPSGNAATVEIGDSTTTSTTGLPIAAGGGLYLAPLPVDERLAAPSHYYNLARQYAYIANGDKLQIVVEK
jgi:hypothetical protein